MTSARLTETQMAIAELAVENRISMEALEKLAFERYPNATNDDFLIGLNAAADMLDDGADRAERELEALKLVSTLFDGMPSGMTLEECAVAKAAKNDPVAISFLAYMKVSNGGEQ
ncbi:hypothetical protein [Brucella anthropi]|uniref:hypothetical protein n=1 Tax=Brucella anthropi TaxID=529 RepID=UPI00236016D3|nr:hypothetical protein [Brucella anthropi]